jgi:hypothetical protein
MSRARPDSWGAIARAADRGSWAVGVIVASAIVVSS